MLELVELAVLGLATWRIASLLGQEDGPAGILLAMRHRLGERYDEYANPFIERLGKKWYHGILYEIADQLTCIWCCTLWVGLLATVLYLLVPIALFYLALPLALSAIGVYFNARGVRWRKRTS